MEQRTIRMIIEDQELLTAPATMTVSEAARQMKQRHVGAVMVVEHDKLVGVFTERDALFRVVADGMDGETTHLAEVMTRMKELGLQLGVVSWEAAQIARAGGLSVVMDRCTKIEWRRLAA